MQPYQEASEEIKRQGEIPFKLGKKALSTAATVLPLAIGAGATKTIAGLAANKVLPLLNKYVPQDLAMKGLNKLDPRFGSFINKALENGISFDEIKDFISEKVGESEQEQPKENRNIIQQYSDNLHHYILDLIKGGDTPIKAAINAKKFLDDKFKNIIKKIEEQHKTSFENIVESIYGREKALPSQSQEPMNQPMQGGQTAEPQGQGRQDLMSILQKIQAFRQGQ